MIAGWRGYLVSGVGGVLLALAAWAGLKMYGKAQYERGAAAERTAQALIAGQVEADYRRQEQAWRDKFEEQENATQEKLAGVVADERRAADVRVRDTAKSVAARYREAAERATAAAERQAASAAITMFAELLSQFDELAGIYAAQADRARVAGLACEAAYDEIRE
ncbi:DUF2514 family protein [Kerstersia similis]|uniref:DUF2514 family protein n=1 Tax=Kerstersia similis TaxID=206505 RepID=UPI0039EE5A74